jgi:hypothetical protein
MKATEDSCTEWFGKQVKPAYVGVYQVKPDMMTFGPLYRYWDGANWYLGNSSPRTARRDVKIKTLHNLLQWRGLKYKPKHYGSAKR